MIFKQPLTPAEIADVFAGEITSTSGDLSQELKDFTTTQGASSSSLTFANNKKLVAEAALSQAAAVVAPEKFKSEVNDSSKTWLFTNNVDLLARNIKLKWVFTTPYRADFNGIDSRAVIADSAQLGKDCIVGPNAVVGDNCVIGDGCFIGANAVVEARCQLGNNTTIHPNAYIGHGTQIGQDCEVMPNATVASEGFGYAHDAKGNHYRIPHTGNVIIEDRVHIGAGTTIDRGTLEDSRVGAGTIIDNQVHFGHNVIVGKNCIFTSNIVVAGSTTIGDNFVCGGNTAITGHITICDNVQVGGMSGVHNSITKPGQYIGYPLEPIKQSLKNKATYVHLSDMRKQLNKISKKVFPEGE